jgi:hypothetical protein
MISTKRRASAWELTSKEAGTPCRSIVVPYTCASFCQDVEAKARRADIVVCHAAKHLNQRGPFFSTGSRALARSSQTKLHCAMQLGVRVRFQC